MKVQIVYKPGAADEQKWVLDRHNPSWDVSYPVEKATDWGWLEFLKRLDSMSPTAWRALIWALRKKDETRLRLEWVEINDWSEIDMLVQCFACEDWISHGGDHECPALSEDDEPEVEAEEPKSKKKAGDPDPEA